MYSLTLFAAFFCAPDVPAGAQILATSRDTVAYYHAPTAELALVCGDVRWLAKVGHEGDLLEKFELETGTGPVAFGYSREPLRVQFEGQGTPAVFTTVESWYTEVTSAGSVDLRVRLRPDKGLRAIMHAIAYPGCGTFARHFEVENVGDKEVVLTNVPSLRLGLGRPADGLTVYSLTGGWGDEFNLNSEHVTGAGKVLEVRAGRSSNGASPWVGVVDSTAGVGLVGALAWSGNWLIALTDQSGAGVLEAGVSPWEFSHVLAPGARFTTPSFFLALHPGDVDLGAQRLHALQRRYLMPHRNRPGWPLVQYNTWYSLGGDVQEEEVKRQARLAADIGCEVFVIDAGWYAIHNWNTLGDWRVNKARFAEGMAEIAEYVGNLGMDFGLWVEIECASSDSSVVQEHPDWIATRDDQPLTGREVLCLAYAPVYEWLLSELDRVVRENQVDWLKIDFNTDPGAGCNNPAHGHGKGDGLYLYYQNLGRLVDELRRRFPDLIVENCSSGGLRMDYSQLQHTHTNWISDEVGPYPSLRHIYGATYAFAPEVCNHWTCYLPAGRDEGYYDFAFAVDMLGQFGISDRLENWDEHTLNSARRNIALYKRLRPRICEGRVYHLTPQPTRDGNSWCAMEYASPDGSEAVLFAFREQAQESECHALLRGLRPEATYRVTDMRTDEMRTYTGASLLTDGLTVSLGQPDSVRILHLAAAEAGS